MRRRSLPDNLSSVVMENAPSTAVERVIALFDQNLERQNIVRRWAALLVPNVNGMASPVGTRSVSVAGREDLLYQAGPYVMVLSRFLEEAGWRVLGQLLADGNQPAPALVELQIGSHRAASRVDAQTGEFGFDGLDSGTASLVFIGAGIEVMVNEITLDSERWSHDHRP